MLWSKKRKNKNWPVAVLALIVFLILGLWLSSSELAAQKKKEDKRTATLHNKSQQKLTPARSLLELREPIQRIKVMSSSQTGGSGEKYSPHQVLVKFRSELTTQSADDILTAYQAKSYHLIPKINVYVVHLEEGISVEDTLSALRNNPDVAYAGPDYKLHLCTTPNDQLFRYQYALSNPGGQLLIPGSPTAKPQADIKATGAWDYVKGDPNTLIAVLDTGIDYTHPDLASKVIDHGRDFVNDDDDAYDDAWHGTHVAGIIAAATNNSEGIAGVAWNCRLLAGKVISASDEGDYSDLIEALIWAADYTNGNAKVGVINMSIGGPEPDDFLEEALRYAYNKGIVLIAAAGNEASQGISYPAAYDSYCLAVGATDYNDKVASFSNYGPELDVAAPGVGIISTIPLAQTDPGYLPYAYANGTSMATPHVAGLAALIKSAKPWLGASDIMKLIKYSPDDVEAAGFDDYTGYGRINAKRALAPYILR
ncbi:MAG TPA: S8 family peptidase [Candidatus Saccharicenans sp.]|nr:S8 family peptidase [Candidatus Saccharicenans sp.]HPU93894.1 S8 family peptidase [Candidatus Saccharicenans sp.]